MSAGHRDPQSGRGARSPNAPAGPDVLDDDFVVLLDSLREGAPPLASETLRERLLARVARSAAASRRMFTVRPGGLPWLTPARGVRQRVLYQPPNAPQRRGEPQCVSWIELAPGSRWSGPMSDSLQRELLVVDGGVQLDGCELRALDCRIVPAGAAIGEITSRDGATLHLREAPRAAHAGDSALTVAEHPDAWHDFAPGIRRRVLWQRDGEAAMLYRAAAGAAVPHHGHGHDEECLMLAGELFIDDVLLRAGDYQLAPAGTEHGGLFTDTGAVIYAHGDLELDVIAS